MAYDANLQMEFQNTARGHMIATSVGASITGKGGDYIIADDLINPAQADSRVRGRHSLVRRDPRFSGSTASRPGASSLSSSARIRRT
jgi:hypothetical protein